MLDLSRYIKIEEDSIVVLMKFGSLLYGTTTENSDLDYKGVFIPTERDVLLGKIPKSISYSSKKGNLTKNTKDDIDIEIYSLHYFLKLAIEGQTVAIDMIHASEDFLEISSDIWTDLVNNRKRFYTKNLKAFIGYARRQAAKYGIKGSRLNAAKIMIEFLAGYEDSTRLSEIWNSIPFGEHIYIIPSAPNNIRQLQVCGKKFQETCTVKYVKDIIERFYKEYGKRAQMAANNEGVDWKSVSHALRAAFQIRELLLSNNITFPLKQADYLVEVKLGHKDFCTEVSPLLDTLMDEIEDLAAQSNLPLHVDKKFWEDWLVETLKRYWKTKEGNQNG